jgi:hypothetical protein
VADALFVLGVPVTLLLTIFYLIPKLTEFLLGALVARMLKSEGNLAKLLLICGIGAFIVGNMLQLWATKAD